ncbi:MAG: T9SS type A sorting domain-containing protein [Saprospiraceae bacterium]|nr:T9SS type A sorting domain-containing protein [Saprospiraceae bacterium]
MKTIKYNVCWMFVLCITAGLQAQTMRWTPVNGPAKFGKCSFNDEKATQSQCYVLEYVPDVTGVLTSYTAGFFVSCTSLGSAISDNQSCSMSSNIRLFNGCSSVGQVLMSSSGNTGTSINNKIQAGVAVMLHQVCLTIPIGESVTIEEDPITDLSTSVDVEGGTFATEYPSFEKAVFHRKRYDDAVLTAFLDFQGTAAGHLVAQLDWSTTPGLASSGFQVERSSDAESFVSIGEQKASEYINRLNSYQFFDKQASFGDNFYRLRLTDANGKVSYSPVRKVTFDLYPFAVSATPNPAKDRLYVQIAHAKLTGKIILLDITGVERLRKDFDPGQSTQEVLLNQIEPGTYTLIVTSDTDTHLEKIVVIR